MVMNPSVEERLVELNARRATLVRELEILSAFRGGGPDPAAVMRMQAELEDLDAEIAALQQGSVFKPR